MHTVVVACCLIVAVAAAARSTWSPCGLSMLSSITPLGEAGRGRRFGSTAAWYLSGSLAGGVCLGAALMVVAWAAATAGLPPAGGAALAAAACGLAALADLGLLGFRLPVLRRQVNEVWLDRYRSWVYGAGFGWQIGVGFATYIMTAAVLALVPLAAASASPWTGFAMGVTFGAFRGSTVALGRGVESGAALRAVHARLDRLGRPVWTAVVGLLSALAIALGASGWPPVLAGLAVVAAGGGLRSVLARRAPTGTAA